MFAAGQNVKEVKWGESIGSLALFLGFILRHLVICGGEMNKHKNKPLFSFIRLQQVNKCWHMDHSRGNVSKFEWKSGQTIWIKEGES